MRQSGQPALMNKSHNLPGDGDEGQIAVRIGLPNATSASNLMERLTTEKIKLPLIESRGVDALTLQQRRTVEALHSELKRTICAVLCRKYCAALEVRTYRFENSDLDRARRLRAEQDASAGDLLAADVLLCRAANERRSQLKNEIEEVLQDFAFCLSLGRGSAPLP